MIIAKIIKTCFEMLKSSEHEKLKSYYKYYKSPNLKKCSEVRSADPPILFYW